MRTLLLAPLVLALCGSTSNAQFTADLVRSDGVLGSQLVYDLSGDANELYILVPSKNAGPVPLSIFDPGDTRVMEVGAEWTNLWRIGFLGGTGDATETYNLPNKPNLHGLGMHTQFVTLTIGPIVIDDLSNPTSLRLGLEEDTTTTIGDLVRDVTAHTSTTLDDGNVLLAGGVTTNLGGIGVTTATLQLFDPQTQKFSDSGASMSQGRTAHTATKLADGTVLLVGGANSAGTITASVDLYDPVADTITAKTPMSVARTQHTATLLSDGRVFVTGGTSDFDFSDPLAALAAIHDSSEIYDPVLNTWTGAASLPKPRVGHNASLTGDGRVLITGGIEVTDLIIILVADFTNDCRLFNPGTGAMQNTSNMSGARAFHGQLTLANGDVLVAGGADGDLLTQTITPLASCRTFTTAGGGAWSNVGSLNSARGIMALVDAGGTVVVAGGLSTIDLTTGSGVAVTDIESTDQTAASWSVAGATNLPRPFAAASVIESGLRVLITGSGDNGSGGATPDETAGVYVP